MANTKITTRVIADDAITSAQIADNAINSEHYVDGSIDTAHYADNSITGAELADNIVIAGTLGSTGKITADAGIDIDNFNIDGTTIALSSGDMTLDVAGDIILDADGGDVQLRDGGTPMARLGLENGDLNIANIRQDYDILFKGMDGNTTPFTALKLDMSDAGKATFNDSITASGSYSSGADGLIAKFQRTGGAVAAAVTYADASTDIEFGTTTNHALSFTTNDTRRLTINNAGAATFTGNVTTTAEIAGGLFKVGSTTVLDGSRNLTNIGTIGSGAITTSGNLTASQSVLSIINNDIRLKTSGDETMLRAVANGAVEIMHNNVAQLRTADGHITVGDSSTPVTLGDFGEVNSYLIANSTSSSATLRFHVGGGAANKERLRIDASGRVLVGLTGASGFGQLEATTLATSGQTILARTSGTVLVGKTSTAFGTAGAALYASGDNDFVNNGNVLSLNRLSADGSIITFYKDSSAVGSITTISGKLNINGPANNSGVRFHTNSVIAQKNNDVVDGQIDLGLSSHRWRELFLSGGVFLGGTDAAHKLDDYEEGTWTPSFNDAGSTSYTAQVGTYTKVGNLVTAWFHLDINSRDTSNTIVLGGIPFASINTSENYGGTGGLHCNSWGTSNKPDNALITPGANVVSFYRSSGQTGVYVPTLADMNGGNLLGFITYRAN